LTQYADPDSCKGVATMKSSPLWTTASLVAAAFAAQAAAAAVPAACSTLAALSLPDTTITTTEEVTGGSLPTRAAQSLTGLPPFCRVAAVTRPAVKFEVWLPLANWNGKLQGVGNGANAGSINYREMANALKLGYATASTDTGHQTENARDASWALGHPELVVDFGHRAIHVTADNAKQIIARFYAAPPRHSYFVACSTGGRQALMEAQRYPEDYDGIIAGAPANNWSQFQTGGHMWAAYVLNKDPDSYVPAAKLKALGDAVNAACDKLDGIADGILADPRKCNYDAKALQCPAGRDEPTCLTPKQARAVNDVWAGARTARGALIYPGYTRGAEGAANGWAAYMTGAGPLSGTHWDQALNTLKYIVFENADWDFRSFDIERDAAFAKKKVGATLDAFDPDLSRFRARGGRLLLYHGWNDPSISPLNTINYYESVVAKAQSEDHVRLFMAPGMLHCGGGPGPNDFEMLPALEQWVEQKQAPERIIASHETKGVVDRTRPLCAFPKAAVYSGSGSTDDAASFVCK
jgi:feruloyl esterase